MRSGENLVLKKYFHIGFAADTPNGLVVPVIRDADRGNLFDLARALAALSEKARAGKLTAAEMQGGSFTDLESRRYRRHGVHADHQCAGGGDPRRVAVGQKPVFDKGAFVPRLMLPLSLSYDHRVIDGAEAARFVVFLSQDAGRREGAAVSEIEVRVPDLGEAKGVTVVDVLVKVGAQMRVDDPLITLESEKASMDVPSPAAGTVASIAVKKGQEVSAGTVIATVTHGEDARPREAREPRLPRRPRRSRACAGRPHQHATPAPAPPQRSATPRRRSAGCAVRRARSGGARRGTGRLYGGLSCRGSRAQGHAHRALADARRRVPQRRLHSLQGAACTRPR